MRSRWTSRGLELAAIVPVTAVIVALGVYPQVVLDRTEEAVTAKVEPRPAPRCAVIR